MLVMIAGIFLMRGPVLGWRMHTIVSGSMYPELRIGEVVVTQQVEASRVSTGSIIAFYSPVDGQLICHRVIDILAAGDLLFRTKGDANAYPDVFLVPAESVVGEVRYSTSILAQISETIRSPFSPFMIAI